MRKLMVAAGAAALVAGGTFAVAQSQHPWLDQQLAKQRYACPAGKSPFRGPADAVVTIVEFGDFECPYWRSNEAAVHKVLAAYPTQVRVVFKNLPLTIHAGAKQKALIAECMGIQGKYWDAYGRFVADDPVKKVTSGVDKGKLNACVSEGGEGQVTADLALAKKLGMATSPSFVVDGIRIGGTLGFPQLKLLIDAEIARKSGTK